MTIKEARKILGKEADGISDYDIQKDIDVAELLKNLFYGLVPKREKAPRKDGNQLPNLP